MDELKAIEESTIDVIVDLRLSIGSENTAKLIKMCGGTQVYIPQMDTVLKSERDRLIFEDFNNGSSMKEIATKYSISEMTVRDLIRKERKLRNERTE